MTASRHTKQLNDNTETVIMIHPAFATMLAEKVAA